MEEFPERFFAREDESADAGFYRQPRLVTHIDDATIAALTDFYAEFLPPASRVLDLMSSLVSHLPDEDFGCVAGLGMNAEELAANPRLTDRVVHDLNEEPVLPLCEPLLRSRRGRRVGAVSRAAHRGLRRLEACACSRRPGCGGDVAPLLPHQGDSRLPRAAAERPHPPGGKLPAPRRLCGGQRARSFATERGSALDRHRGLSTARLRRRDHSCLLARTIHECA